MNPHVKQKSWKRRTDLNTFGYFGFLIALSVLTFWYTHYANTNAISDDTSYSTSTQIDANLNLQANFSTEDSSKIKTLCINETIVALKVRSNNYDVD